MTIKLGLWSELAFFIPQLYFFVQYTTYITLFHIDTVMSKKQILYKCIL